MRTAIIVRGTAVLAVLLGIVAVWEFTPLSEWIEPERLAVVGQLLTGHWSGYLAGVGLFVVGGVLIVPQTAMVAGAVLVYGPVAGFLLSMAGSIVSAAALYAIGNVFGGWLGRQRIGSRVDRISHALARRGLLAMIVIRQIPIAPYSVVNLAVGASHIGFRDYILGTGIGILPWVLALTLMTEQFYRAIRDPNFTDAALFVVVVVVLVGAAFVTGRWLLRWLRRRDPGARPPPAPSGDG